MSRKSENDRAALAPLSEIRDPYERLLRALSREPAATGRYEVDQQIKRLWELVPELHGIRSGHQPDPKMRAGLKRDRADDAWHPADYIVPWDNILFARWFADTARKRGIQPDSQARWDKYTMLFKRVKRSEGQLEPAWTLHAGYSSSTEARGYPAKYVFPDGRLISGNDVCSMHGYKRSFEFGTLGPSELRTMAAILRLEP